MVRIEDRVVKERSLHRTERRSDKRAAQHPKLNSVLKTVREQQS